MKINEIKPKNNRPISLSKPVHVYRNLHNGMWSIKQGNWVVGWAEKLYLRDVDFRVGAAGSAKAKREHKKNVHAYIRGTLASPLETEKEYVRCGIKDDECFPYCKVGYNPYNNYSFIDLDSGGPIYEADYVCMDINASDTMGKVLAIFKSFKGIKV